MDLKNFFNILLLAISLTTILVTLVSYIVFKLRLASTKAGAGENPLEGAFFHRFSPKLQEKYNELLASEEEKSDKKISFKVKFVSLFMFLFLIIAGLLLFEDYFSYRRDLSERTMAAKEFRALVKDGHLKSYEYSPRNEPIEFSKKISNNSTDQLSYLTSALKNSRFCLISTARAKRFSNRVHSLALKQWRDFLNRNDLKFSIRGSIVDTSDCIRIYPHIHSLSNSQRASFGEFSGSALVIGHFGSVDGLGGSVEQSETEKIIGRKILSQASTQPTLISSEKDYLWEIDGGSFLSWFPIDKDASHILSKEGNIISSDYNGKILREGDDILSREFRNEKITWSSLDPINHPYSDLVFLNIFAKMKGIPVFKIENYRDSKIGVSFVYRQNQQTDDLEKIKEVLSPMKSPWTLFTNNFYYEGLELDHKERVSYEVAVLTSPDHNFDKLDSRTSFNLVENLRLKLEELSFSGVRGLTTYNNFLENTVLDASDQNKLSYLYGTTKVISYSPVFLKGLNFLLVPKMFRSTKELLGDKTIESIDDFTQALELTFSNSQMLGGLAVYDISSLEVDNYLLLNALKNMVAKLEGKSVNIGEVVGWKRAKNNLKLSSMMDGGDLLLNIENSSNRSATNFKILFDGANGREEFMVEKVGANTGVNIRPSSYRDR